MKKFTNYVNRTLPGMINELQGEPCKVLRKVESEGARPYYGAKDLEIQHPVDHMLSYMLKNKILDGYDSVMKFFSYMNLREDLKKPR